MYFQPNDEGPFWMSKEKERERKEGYNNIKQNGQMTLNKGRAYLKAPRTSYTHNGKHHQHQEVMQRKGNSTGRNRYTVGSSIG